ncbi:MAG TPA: phosphate signaling complex protein PhoU [Spirochaetota bacterium]|nr:phosphate signaling complex protein PhoU [Spirochaetota bacterium]
MEGHTNKSYDRDLSDLKQNLLLLGNLVERSIISAIKALEEMDGKLAASVIADDDQIDRKEVEIDEFCHKVIALRQPAAKDLRFITTALKINYDLERIGDMAVNICERVVELVKEPQLKPYVTIPQMAETVQAMLRDSLASFIHEDVDLALTVKKDDEKVDELLQKVCDDLQEIMSRDGASVSRAMRLVFVSKYLERIGDHATNIAELVIFMVQGKTIRHEKEPGSC